MKISASVPMKNSKIQQIKYSYNIDNEKKHLDTMREVLAIGEGVEMKTVFDQSGVGEHQPCNGIGLGISDQGHVLPWQSAAAPMSSPHHHLESPHPQQFV